MSPIFQSFAVSRCSGGGGGGGSSQASGIWARALIQGQRWRSGQDQEGREVMPSDRSQGYLPTATQTNCLRLRDAASCSFFIIGATVLSAKGGFSKLLYSLAISCMYGINSDHRHCSTLTCLPHPSLYQTLSNFNFILFFFVTPWT